MGEAIQPAEFVNVSRLGQLTAEELRGLQDELLVHDNEGRTIAVVIGYQQFMELRDKLWEAQAALAARAMEALASARKQIDALGAGVSFGAVYGSTLSKIGYDCRRIAGEIEAVLSSPTAEAAQSNDPLGARRRW